MVANATSTTTTLYPKILGDIRPFLRSLDRYGISPSRDAPLYMTGTVKLHGTHADIRVDLSAGSQNATIVPQSRNNKTLTPARDNFGFAAFCASQHDAIVRLAERIRERWRQLHPDQKHAPDGTVLLAGEWIGHQIQSKPATAIQDLAPRLFVLCSVRIQGAWAPLERYADVADERARLYNVSRGGFFRAPFARDAVGGDSGLDEAAPARWADPAARTFVAEARRLTAAVCARCPFGAALGVEGPGEGIVWTPAPDQGVPNVSELWLKTKGEDFEGTGLGPNGHVRKKGMAGQDGINAFVSRACHERRLEQGWDYLREMHVERDRKGLQTFLDWVTRDIEVEEQDEIAEHRLGGQWKTPAVRVARTWYLRQLQEEAKGGLGEPN